MNETLKDLMQDATRLTRAGKLTEATALLQRFLGGKSDASPAPTAASASTPLVLDGCVFETQAPGLEPKVRESRPAAQGGEFLSGTHTHASLTRSYKLYVPPGAEPGKPLPLLVMLHGCTQNPDDFAAGTGMNELALRQGFFVLYPAQSQDANTSRCWNWFKHNHQLRDRGEPALIASLTRTIAQSHPVDPARIYVAGLSAGGAMAAIMSAAYPEIYAAVGVHSGLAPGAAGNLDEALSAMNGVPGVAMPLGARGLGPKPAGAKKVQPIGIPTIVFHGDQDKTVNPANGDQVMQARLAGDAAAAPRLEQGASGKGRRFTRKTYRDGNGQTLGEHWLIHGAGHAWSGGSAAGSYTDASGPDASGEMLRFFLENPRRDR